MSNQASIYANTETNPTIENADNSRPNIAVCFSGGGSRALTCAWGQLIGLTGTQLINKVRYISSVSGGTWASSVYTFLPNNISDDDLLGKYVSPQDLSLDDGTNKLNVNTLNPHSLGQAPAGMSLIDLTTSVLIFLCFNKKSDHKWLWADIVANYVLKPFDLQDEGEYSWSSSKFFTLSAKYADNNFPQNAPSLNDFFFVRQERPLLIMNDNIMQTVAQTEKGGTSIVQLPNQATPVSAGSKGQTPQAGIVGGGTVESYGFTSTLDQSSADTSPVDISISQPYSLIDSVSTSSAFFAEAVLNLLKGELDDAQKKQAVIDHVKQRLSDAHKKTLLSRAEGDGLKLTLIDDIIEHYAIQSVQNALADTGSIVPAYNYWPIGSESQNTVRNFTDGGTLDNTGIIGILSQTDTGHAGQEEISLIAFDNTDVPLVKKGNNIIAGAQAAPLFGIDFDVDNGTYQPFTVAQQDPSNADFSATSLTQVFDNSVDASGTTPFEQLVKGLYRASCGTAMDENTDPAFIALTLTTVSNSLANILAERKVMLFYVQNARINNWQNNLGDPKLKSEIEAGQKAEWPFDTFANFPYYSTFTKIGLEAKESNCLSQMWAWATSDDGSPLKTRLQSFVNGA